MNFMNSQSILTEINIADQIWQYGKVVLCSEAFAATSREIHHIYSTLQDHTLNVTIKATEICLAYQRRSKPIDTESVVLASLLHDFGMLGRNSKFKGSRAWTEHPKYSVQTAQAILPELKSETAAIIAVHMWPITKQTPKTREEFVVIYADKFASFIDWFYIPVQRKYKASIKEDLFSRIQEETENDSKGQSLS